MIRLRLRDHLVGAAEAVEVVHVDRAEVDLQRLEHVVERDAVLLRLDAIHVGADLRHVHLVVREHARELRRLTRLRDHGLRGLEQLVVADVGAVLDLQLEAADRAEPLDGRRREHHDARFLDLRQRAVQLLRDVQAVQLRGLAVFEGVEREEHERGVRAVGEARDRQARELHGVVHARRLHADVGHAPHDFFRAIQRRGGRQVDDRHQVLLVLHRDEALRHDLEQAPGERQQAGEHAHDQALVTEHAAHAFHVLRSGALEDPVEATEESAEHLVHAAGQHDRACAPCGLSSRADSAGLSVSELIAEITVEIAIVSANCL